MHALIHLFVHALMHARTHACIHVFMHSFSHSFISFRSSIHSFIHTFIHSFVRSFIHSLIHSSIHSLSLFIHSSISFHFHFILFQSGLFHVMSCHFIRFIRFMFFSDFIHFIHVNVIHSFIHSCIHVFMYSYLSIHSFVPFIPFMYSFIFMSFHFVSFHFASFFSCVWVWFDFHFHFHFVFISFLFSSFSFQFVSSFIHSLMRFKFNSTQFMSIQLNSIQLSSIILTHFLQCIHFNSRLSCSPTIPISKLVPIAMSYFSPNNVATLGVLTVRVRAQCSFEVVSGAFGIFLINFCTKWLLWHVHVHFDCAGSHKTGAPCPGISVRHFPCKFLHKIWLLWHVHEHFDCAGSHKTRVAVLRGIFPVIFCLKSLLWHVHVHFECAGSHKMCDKLLGRGISCKFLSQMALMTCPCAFRLRRLAQNEKSCIETSCQETSHRELVQRSCQETSSVALS